MIAWNLTTVVSWVRLLVTAGFSLFSVTYTHKLLCCLGKYLVFECGQVHNDKEESIKLTLISAR